MKLVPTLLIVLALPAAANPVSPYAGQEARDIKTLSEAEIAGYLAGDGMGFAKAAELNRYPGPRHVLDLAEQLELSPTQHNDVEKIFESMRSGARTIGQHVVSEERELNRLFAEHGVTDKQLQNQVNKIARLQGELRYVHLRAHIATRALLTPEQTRQYNMLRGYHDTGGQPHPHSH